MIEQIGGSGPRPTPQQPKTPMTEAQTNEITDLLAQYDPDNMSAEEAREFVAKVGELGILPGSGLAALMRESGFEAREVAKLAGIDGPGGPRGPAGPPPGDGSLRPPGATPVDEAIVSLFTEVAESFRASDKTVSFSEMLASAMEEAGYEAGEPLVDYYA